MSIETDEVEVTIIGVTEKAYIFKTESGERAFFPKSEVSFKTRNIKTGKAVVIIPLWLLEKKEWNQ